MMRDSGSSRRPDDAAGDGEVVARVLAGEQEAYRILVRRHQDSLYRYALRTTGDADTASDVVQTAFVKGFTRLDRCRQPDRFGAWIFRIVANACKDHFRRRRGGDVRLDDDGVALELPGDSDPEGDAERSELRRLLNRALATLSAEQREAFVLKHVEHRSYAEMASLLDASVSALKMRVHRAREALRAELEEVVE